MGLVVLPGMLERNVGVTIQNVTVSREGVRGLENGNLSMKEVIHGTRWRTDDEGTRRMKTILEGYEPTELL